MAVSGLTRDELVKQLASVLGLDTSKAWTIQELSQRYWNSGLALVTAPATLDSLPIYLYGNSYSVLSANYFTPGNHYAEKTSVSLGGGPVVSYGVSGKRILDVLSGLINEAPFPGLVTSPVAGAEWPGTSKRKGVVVLELLNDYAHYATMVTPVPTALPSGNTRYKDSMVALLKAFCALVSIETRVEQSARTATSGVWTHDSTSSYASNGSVSYTTAAGAYVEYTVTPPQSGPLAGKVFLFGFSVDPALGTMAQQLISVDGVLQTTRTPQAWEQYTGPGGALVNIVPDVTTVTLPIDGNSHIIRLAHNGTAGHLMYSDQVGIPSVLPFPVVIMGGEHPLATTTWTAAQRSIYTANEKVLTPVLKGVLTEFPNVAWSASTLTAEGLYSGDGIHPNDLGMAQRSVGLTQTIQTSFKSFFKSRSLTSSSANNYPIL